MSDWAHAAINLALDYEKVRKRERSCPLCGAIMPPCVHAVAAKKILEQAEQPAGTQAVRR